MCFYIHSKTEGNAKINETQVIAIMKLYILTFVQKSDNIILTTKFNRGVAQVVAHQTGGLGAASSSLVTPTNKK